MLIARTYPMRILIFTPWFYPNFGGVETVTDLLARGLTDKNEVLVITSYPSNQQERERPYRVLRSVNIAEQLREVRRADVVLMFGAALRFIWMPLLLGKPVVVNHFKWFPWRLRPFNSALQRLMCVLVTNVAPSQIVARHIGGRTLVIPNPFEARLFHVRTERPRDLELIFLGRLDEVKGIDTLLASLTILRSQNVQPQATIIGAGPAEKSLRILCKQLGLDNQVRWAGALFGDSLARELARHQVMVVPSRWREPFGIVALEGLASGCRLVISDNGGLPEVAGAHALRFTAGDPESLADAIRSALASNSSATDRAAVDRHLARFSVENVTREYQELLGAVVAAS
jgi:glycogen(starch) synthase